MLKIFTLFSALLWWSTQVSHATNYFVSSQGDDSQTGTSVTTAWRTIARTNAVTFQPGDRLLFESGQTFSGSIELHGGGTASQPFIVSSYGRGAATIASGTASGISSYNVAGVEVRRLIIIGSAQSNNNNSGVNFYSDLPSGDMSHIRFDSLDVSGYLITGIAIGTNVSNSGYSDVRITNCLLHDNGEAGLYTYATISPSHQNWYVGNCKAYNNLGRRDITNHNTGSGLVIGGVDDCLVEFCESYNNGALNAFGLGGPAGIWGFISNNLVIQYCESHHNASGTYLDGGGFDLDGGCTNSILQYNYSHDNQGPGYLLSQYNGAPSMHDLTIRYNVSDNDALVGGQGALEVWSSGSSGGIVHSDFYNNTVRVGPAYQAKAIKIMSCVTDLTFRNNILQTGEGGIVVSAACTNTVYMEGNCYWSSTNSLVFDWPGATCADLNTWRTASGQETMPDGRRTGISQDPMLPSSLTKASAWNSPVRGAGLNLMAEFGINPGPHDFAGNPTPTTPNAGNIGAFEVLGASPLPVALTSFIATRSNANALLRWTTASELNSAYFAVEFSLDGQAFSQVTQVPAQGNSSQAHTYQFTDTNLARYPAGSVYYRLRQVDTDGHTTYSPTCTLSSTSLGTTAQLQVYPSPASTTGAVQVAGAPAQATVQLLDAQGRLLTTVRTSADGTAKLLVSGQAPGLYLVRCGTQSTKLLLIP